MQAVPPWNHASLAGLEKGRMERLLPEQCPGVPARDLDDAERAKLHAAIQAGAVRTLVAREPPRRAHALREVRHVLRLRHLCGEFDAQRA
jgi:hypothetical protein